MPPSRKVVVKLAAPEPAPAPAPGAAPASLAAAASAAAGATPQAAAGATPQAAAGATPQAAPTSASANKTAASSPPARRRAAAATAATPPHTAAVFANHDLLREIAGYLQPNALVGLTQLRGVCKPMREAVDGILSSLDELAFDDIDVHPPFGDGAGGGGSERDKRNLEALAAELNGRLSERMVDFLLPRVTPARVDTLQLEGWMSPAALDALLPALPGVKGFFFEPGPMLYHPAQVAALLRRSAPRLTTLVLCYSWSHWARVGKKEGGGGTPAAAAAAATTAAGAAAAAAASSSEADAAAITAALGDLSLEAGGGGAGNSQGGAAASSTSASSAKRDKPQFNLRTARGRAAVAAAAAAAGTSTTASSSEGREKSIFEETPEERAARLAATAAAVKESASAHGELAAAIATCNGLRVLELTLPMPWPAALPLADTLPPDAPLRVLDLFLQRPNLAPEVTAAVARYGRTLRELAVTCQLPNDLTGEAGVANPELAGALMGARRLRSLRLSGFALDMSAVLPALPHLEELVGTCDGMVGCELALFVCPKLARAHLIERRLVEPDPLGAVVMAAADEAVHRATVRANLARAAATPQPDSVAATHDDAAFVLDLTPKSAAAAAAPAAPAPAPAADAPPAPALPLCSRLTELTLVFQQTYAAYEARAAAGAGPAALREAAAAARAASEAVPGNSSRGSLRRAFLRALPHMTALEHLDLRRGSNYGPLLRALAASPAAASLKSLTLQHVGDLAVDDVLALARAAPALTDLFLLHCGGLAGKQRDVLRGVHGLLVARGAAKAPAAAATPSGGGLRISVAPRPGSEALLPPVGPAADVRVCFGNCVSQLDADLARALADADAAAAPPPSSSLPLPPLPGELALLDRPTEA